MAFLDAEIRDMVRKYEQLHADGHFKLAEEHAIAIWKMAEISPDFPERELPPRPNVRYDGWHGRLPQEGSEV